MATQIDICNMALAHLGIEPISSLSDTDRVSRACNLFYDSSRRELLEMHNWNFALREYELSKGTDNFTNWDFAYIYPSNCLRIIRLFSDYSSDNKDTEEFVILQNSSSQKRILTNIDDAKIIYIHDVEDTTAFSGLFINCLSYYLASKLSMSITGDLNKQKAMNDQFVSYLSLATSSSKNEEGYKMPQKSSYIDAR